MGVPSKVEGMRDHSDTTTFQWRKRENEVLHVLESKYLENIIEQILESNFCTLCYCFL